MRDERNITPLREDEITMYIIANNEMRDKVVGFVSRLYDLGVLKIFMDGDELDKLNEILRSQNILSGQYASINYTGADLLRNYESHFCRQVARQIAAVKVRSEEEIEKYLDVILELWQTPKHAFDLFLEICDLATRLRNVYQMAIGEHFERKTQKGLYVVSKSDNVEKITSYWEGLSKERDEIFALLNTALPLGTESSEDTVKWMEENRDILDRIDFTAMMEHADFETGYEILFLNKPKTVSGIWKEDVRSIVMKSFKALVLKDCMEILHDPLDKTSEAFTSVIQGKAKDESLRYLIRFVQAMFMFYRDDARIIRERTRRTVIQSLPTLHNGGTINIPN